MMTAAGVERARNSRRDSSLYSAQAWQSGLLMLIFISGGLRPAGPPYTLARGAPCAPLRSRGSLAVARSRRSVPRLDAHLYLRGASPRPPPLPTRSRRPLVHVAQYHWNPGDASARPKASRRWVVLGGSGWR